MTLKDLVTTSKKERLRRQRAKAAQDIATGALIGVAAGAALGTLLAPKSGKETREDIKKMAMDTADRVKSAASTVGATLADAADTIKNAAVNTADTVKEGASAAADDLADRSDDAGDRAEAVVKDVKEGVRDIGDAVRRTGRKAANDLK